MHRINDDVKKKVRFYSKVSNAYYDTEEFKKVAAIRRIEKENSVPYKTDNAGRACFNTILHNAEKKWKTALKSHNNTEIEEARINFLRALDQAAANSTARIIAEIKQTHLISKKLFLNTFIETELSVEDFYVNFQKFYKKEYGDYTVSKEEFNNIISRYLNLNLISLNSYGDKIGYTKPAEQFEKNIKCIEKIAVKEKELSL